LPDTLAGGFEELSPKLGVLEAKFVGLGELEVVKPFLRVLP
jgi:hypothetical protein